MPSSHNAPESVDAHTPNVARMYDYWLGGKDNFAADRDAANKIIEISSGSAGPTVVEDVRANRAFLGRAVRMVAAAGTTQFLDLGSGLPTRDNVHDVARLVNPGARVAYVDYDPVVRTHGLALLAGHPGVEFVQADLRSPRTILEHPDVLSGIDFTRPVAVLLVAVLHFIQDDDDPFAIVAELAEALAPGSHLILSHLSTDARPTDISQGARVYTGASAPLAARTRAEIMRFFDGFELIEPGLVNTPAWRPDRPTPDADRYPILGAVARKL